MRRSRRLLAAVLLVRAVDEFAAFLPAGALESYRGDLNLSYTTASAVLLALGLGSLPGMALSAGADRFSRRVIASVGAGCYAAALALFAWAPGATALVVAALLLGVGSTGMVDGVEVALTDLVTSDRLRVWLARSNLGAVVGGLCGPALLAVMALGGAEWRMAFVVGALLVAAYGVLLAVSPLPAPASRARNAAGDDAPDGATPDTIRDATILDVVRDGRVWMIGLLSFVMVPFDEPFFAFLIAHLQQTRGASPAGATVVAMAAVGGGLLVQGAAARRPLRLGDHALYVLGAVALLTGSFVAAVVPLLAAVAIAAAVVGAGLELCWLAVQHRTLTLRPGQAGRTSAVVSAIEQVGFVLPVGVGVVADATNLTGAMGVFALLGALLLMLAAGARRTLG